MVVMKSKSERERLGTRLREARIYRGFSQEEVASYVGVSRTSVSLMESGQRGIDTLELQRLSELFELNVNDLLGEEDLNRVDKDSPSIAMVARAAKNLSQEDREEVLRFAQFLRARKRGKKE